VVTGEPFRGESRPTTHLENLTGADGLPDSHDGRKDAFAPAARRKRPTRQMAGTNPANVGLQPAPRVNAALHPKA
jgi:hypothetical protein